MKSNLILPLLLLTVCTVSTKAQTKLRDYYLIRPIDAVAKGKPNSGADGNSKESQIFYLKAKKIPAKPESSTIQTTITTTTGTHTTTAIEKREIITTLGKGTTEYDTIQAHIRIKKGVTFRVRQEKDTLYLTPLHFKKDNFSAPNKDYNAVQIAHSVNSTNAGVYFIKLSKKPNEAGNPTLLLPITWNIGLLTVPARLYLGAGGSKSQLSLISGAAVYVSKSGFFNSINANHLGNKLIAKKGFRKFYSDGTSSYAALEPLAFLGATMLSPTSDAPSTVTATIPALSFGVGGLIGNGDLKTGLIGGYDIPVAKTENDSYYKHSFFLGIVLSLEVTPFANGANK
jgi:hypothetical protein